MLDTSNLLLGQGHLTRCDTPKNRRSLVGPSTARGSAAAGTVLGARGRSQTSRSGYGGIVPRIGPRTTPAPRLVGCRNQRPKGPWKQGPFGRRPSIFNSSPSRRPTCLNAMPNLAIGPSEPRPRGCACQPTVRCPPIHLEKRTTSHTFNNLARFTPDIRGHQRTFAAF